MALKKSAPPKKVTASIKEVAEPLRYIGKEPQYILTHIGNYPDAKSEFIAELSQSISKWRGRAGKEADAYATAYENVLYQLLAPDPNND